MGVAVEEAEAAGATQKPGADDEVEVALQVHSSFSVDSCPRVSSAPLEQSWAGATRT